MKVKHCINRRDGIQYLRRITKILTQGNKEYYISKTKDENSLGVGLKEIPSFMKILEIQEELIECGLSRIYQKQNGEKIYKRLVKIQIKSQTTSANILQCHRCQSLGHNQSQCRQIPKCVNCASYHLAEEFSKIRNNDLKCAHCGCKYSASYTGCR